MARTVGIGIQDFEKVIDRGCFYVDKTAFIKKWWEHQDDVTLITRPRRFGKTLTLSMLEYFFSVKYTGKGMLFENLAIWEEEKYRKMQGQYPVISLSFANVKEKDYDMAVYRICQILQRLYIENYFLLESDKLTEGEKKAFKEMADNMPVKDAPAALNRLSDYLCRYYEKKVLVFLDEYDTPLQEAYIGGCWQEMVEFIRSFFHFTFKTNPYLDRAIMTGITRVSKESVFSDLNNMEVVSATSNKYADVFGFTEQEVFEAMDEMGVQGKEAVKFWYDGFVFGKEKDIYNPWSITNFLNTGKLGAYWANSSGNGLAGKLLQEGAPEIKIKFEELLAGKSVVSELDEEIVYDQLDNNIDSIWSLLLASGYLKVLHVEEYGQAEGAEPKYELALTNREVRFLFKKLVSGWFRGRSRNAYNDFMKALLMDDIDAMNEYMNKVASSIFSYFDTEQRESERFYHGFVLGLMMDLEGRYVIRSNRESGFGRYDIILEPLKEGDNAIVIEFKVYQPRKEKKLEDTVHIALQQIEEKGYEQELLARGISQNRIFKYGFAFKGKEVLIGSGAADDLCCKIAQE